MVDPTDQTTGDLFEEPPVQEVPHQIPPSESVFCDMGEEALTHIGEIQMPRPTPVEIVVEIDGWDYIYKLSERRKQQ